MSAADSSQALQVLLKRYWGPEFSLRSHQPQIVQALTEGRDVLALLPTGEGKSLCYQLSGIYIGGVTLVISPLIALMQDQVQSLRARGLEALQLQGGLSASQRQQILRHSNQQSSAFVYLSPEQLQGAALQKWFQQHPPRLIVIDEAHCISQWGHDFRPAYRQIPDFIASLPQRPIIGAFTATAPPDVAADIASLLQLQAPEIARGIPLQPHIQLRVSHYWTPAGKWRSLLAEIGGKTLIYATTRGAVEELAQRLNQHLQKQTEQREALIYHAGCSPQQREQAFESFAHSPDALMVATKAFGMGVDIPDIRQVLHWQTPESLAAYVQEVGRAGRNRQGLAQGILLNLRGEKSMLGKPWPDHEIRAVLKVLKQVKSQAELRQRLQISDNHLNSVLLPLERQGNLVRDQRSLSYQPQPDDFKQVKASIQGLQHQRQQQTQQMQAYLRSKDCRRRQLYQAFGLEPDFDKCEACDRCL